MDARSLTSTALTISCLLLLLALTIPVEAGRIVAFRDTACSDRVGIVEGYFTAGDCYVAEPSGSTLTQCITNFNTTSDSFVWKYYANDRTCSSLSGSITGMGDGSCVVVRVGLIGSMQVYCSEAWSTSAPMSFLFSGALSLFAVVAARYFD